MKDTTKSSKLESLTLADIAITTAAAIAVATLLRIFVVGIFSVSSHSMENTLLDGDNIIVSKTYAWLSTFERGDVVVFNVPDTLSNETDGEPFVKRIIALAGDTVIVNSEAVFVNGKQFPMPPLSANPRPVRTQTVIQVVVPPNEIFVMGDNRPFSWDSRHWGTLPADKIIGKALITYWSYGPTTNIPTPHIRLERFLRFVE